MKITREEILRHFGFKVPPGGIEVNPEDAVYHTTALQLLGKTLSAASIPDEALHDRHAKLLAAHGAASQPECDAEAAERSRASLRAAIRAFYGVSV